MNFGILNFKTKLSKENVYKVIADTGKETPLQLHTNRTYTRFSTKLQVIYYYCKQFYPSYSMFVPKLFLPFFRHIQSCSFAFSCMKTLLSFSSFKDIIIYYNSFIFCILFSICWVIGSNRLYLDS